MPPKSKGRGRGAGRGRGRGAGKQQETRPGSIPPSSSESCPTSSRKSKQPEVDQRPEQKEQKPERVQSTSRETVSTNPSAILQGQASSVSVELEAAARSHSQVVEQKQTGRKSGGGEKKQQQSRSSGQEQKQPSNLSGGEATRSQTAPESDNRPGQRFSTCIYTPRFINITFMINW